MMGPWCAPCLAEASPRSLRGATDTRQHTYTQNTACNATRTGLSPPR